MPQPIGTRCQFDPCPAKVHQQQGEFVGVEV